MEELLGKIFLLPSHNQNTLIQPNVKGIVLSNKNRGQRKANAECGMRNKKRGGERKANADCALSHVRFRAALHSA